MTFDEVKAKVPGLADDVVKLMLDVPSDALLALVDLFERTGRLDDAVVDSLAVRIASVREMRSQMTDEVYREAVVRAIAAKPH